MAMASPEGTDTPDCIVVGGGLAGLSCALGLARAGRSVHLIEAETAVGGRARSVWHGGRPVDMGIHVILGGYQRTRRLLKAIDLPRRDLRPVEGVVFMRAGERRVLGASRLRGARLPGIGAPDRVRLARLVAEVAGRPHEALLARDDDAASADALLLARGFSGEAIEGLLRPLLGTLLLDRGLAVDPGYFRCVLAMLLKGPAVMPADGIGMVAEWTAAAIGQAGGRVETGVRVEALDAGPDGASVAAVATSDGRRLAARQVVLAVDAPAARRLLAPLDAAAAERIPTEGASATTAAFALRRPLYSGRVILLNADDAPSGRPRIDAVCQTTGIGRPGASEGPHILLATAVTTGGAPFEGIAGEVGSLVRRWAPGYDWAGQAELIDVYEAPYAHYRSTAGVRRSLPGHRTALRNLILAGEYTSLPSIEGAVAGGARAAEIVDALIP
ncbi:MAG: FAD-dependent oxidoreductase [Thermoleophilia bacterium]